MKIAGWYGLIFLILNILAHIIDDESKPTKKLTAILLLIPIITYIRVTLKLL